MTSDDKIAVLLVGGHSRRMGTDKFALKINGQPHWENMLLELNSFFNRVFISCREDQKHLFENHELILDSEGDIGPMGALYASFKALPQAEHIFFVACDLPYFEISLAQDLYKAFDVGYDVCAAQSEQKSFPEPLVAIWNRSALPYLQRNMKTKNYALYRCMRAMRLQSVKISSDKMIQNVNTPEDLKTL